MKNCFIDTKRFSVAGFFGLTHIEIERIGGHIVDYSDYNTRYNDNVKEYILAAVSDYLDDIYKDLGCPQIDSPI